MNGNQLSLIHHSPKSGKPSGRIPLLELQSDAEGVLVERMNRFLALVDMSDTGCSGTQAAHVHDPGRLEELLFPGNAVLLRRARDTSKRKTGWDILAARSRDGWTLIHSGFHRAIMEGVFRNSSVSPFDDPRSIRPETRFGSSRLDFLMEFHDQTRIAIETKGCSLVRNTTALFPDAPTKRGARHMGELIRARDCFGRAAVCMLVTNPGASRFMPYRARDPVFADAFASALSSGVEASAHVVEYDGFRVYYIRRIPVLAGT